MTSVQHSYCSRRSESKGRVSRQRPRSSSRFFSIVPVRREHMRPPEIAPHPASRWNVVIRGGKKKKCAMSCATLILFVSLGSGHEGRGGGNALCSSDLCPLVSDWRKNSSLPEKSLTWSSWRGWHWNQQGGKRATPWFLFIFPFEKYLCIKSSTKGH